MTKGLGYIERQLYRMLVADRKNDWSIYSTQALAKAIQQKVFETKVSFSNKESVHRSLRSLERKGLVFSTERRAFGKKYWGCQEAINRQKILSFIDFGNHNWGQSLELLILENSEMSAIWASLRSVEKMEILSPEFIREKTSDGFVRVRK